MPHEIKKSPRTPLSPKPAQKNKMDSSLQTQAAREGLMALSAFLQVMIRGKAIEQESNEAWEKVRRDVANLDSETRSFCARLESELQGHKEKTERLRLVLNYLHDNGKSLPESVQLSFAESIGKLTSEL